MLKQRTLKSCIKASGVGLHSGAKVTMLLRPAAPDTGIVFRRIDLDPVVDLPASATMVGDTRMCSCLESGGAKVGTIEHLMSAFAGLGIDNAFVDLDAAEVPILDGSSAPFVQGILEAGLRRQPDAALRAIRVLRPVEVRVGEGFARLSPADHLEIHFDIDFTDAAIGHQEKQLDMANGTFLHELMDSRTFCRQADVVKMQENGLALGGTYLNAVVIDGDKVLSPGGLRHEDEAVRHKMLDAVGDLGLAGAPLLARYTGHRAGHAMTNKLLRALFAQPDAWEWVVLTPAMESRLPGAGVVGSAARMMPHMPELAVA